MRSCTTRRVSGIAGELYSQVFYDQLARVLKRKGRLFHYTGAPNKLTSGRDVPREVAKRLRLAGFAVELSGRRRAGGETVKSFDAKGYCRLCRPEEPREPGAA